MRSLLVLVVLCLTLAQDFYELLEVAKDADKETIQKSFKQLSRKYHPDKNLNNREEAEAKFMKIAHAYEVLSDPIQRKVYNAFGEAAISDPFGFAPNLDPQHEAFRDPEIRKFFMGDSPTSEMFEQTDVTELFAKNLQHLDGRKSDWMVLFYTPSCNECKTMKNDYAKFANALYGIAEIAAVNCEKEKSICNRFYVSNYPTLLFFPINSRKFEYYKGPKKFNNFMEYISGKLDSVADMITETNLSEFTDRNLPKLLFFVGGTYTPPYVKAISVFFHGKVTVGEVRVTEYDIYEKFNVTKTPSLLGLMDTPLSFTKKYYIDEIEVFIENYTRMYNSNTKTVAELTENNFQQGVCGNNHEGHCLLVIVKPDEGLQQRLYELEVKLTSERAQVYWVDSEKYPGITQMFGKDYVLLRPKWQKYAPIDCTTLECVVRRVPDLISKGSGFRSMPGSLRFTGASPDL